MKIRNCAEFLRILGILEFYQGVGFSLRLFCDAPGGDKIKRNDLTVPRQFTEIICRGFSRFQKVRIDFHVFSPKMVICRKHSRVDSLTLLPVAASGAEPAALQPPVLQRALCTSGRQSDTAPLRQFDCSTVRGSDRSCVRRFDTSTSRRRDSLTVQHLRIPLESHMRKMHTLQNLYVYMYVF